MAFNSSGWKFREALKEERPLQIIGVSNAYVAMMAARAGYKALYLSGAGIANYAFGLPDSGITTLKDVCEESRRVTAAINLPVLVDIDTGWGDAGETVRQLEAVGVAAVQIEDQVEDKRCGHLDGKRLVSVEEMCERIKAAVGAKKDPFFVVMARTDALAVEGMEATLERVVAYCAAGAEMIFVEAVTELAQYSTIKAAAHVPILANITEFGKTPMFTTNQLAEHGVEMVLYPLSVVRTMNKAAENALREIREKGTQEGIVKDMQTRQQLYDVLEYEA